ncbi:MAG: hypothetical protein EBQ99_05975 [Planctomycetes bacterium]|nr:hypothetical protein [Planctomycetota bacterium]
MASNSLILIAWLGGLALAGTLLVGVWWALFADRSRGVHRCPRCWHRMNPAVGLRCSECGHLVFHEQALLQTRRRWLLAILCLLLLVLGTFGLRTTIASRGWWTMLPHRAVLAVMPWLPPSGHLIAVRQHMLEELGQQHVSPDDTVRMLELVKGGDLLTTPGTDAWRSTHLRWLATLEDLYTQRLLPPDDPLRLAAIDLPPVIHVNVPERWHRGEPLVGMVEMEDWWPAGVEVTAWIDEIEGLPVDAAAQDRLHRTRWRRPDREPRDGSRQVFAIDLGPLPEGTYRGHVTLSWRTHDRLGSAGLTGQGVVRMPVRAVVRGDAPALDRIENPALDALIAQTFADGILRSTTLPTRHIFSYAPFFTSGEAHEAVAFGLIVEACEAGTPRRTLRVWWRGGINRAQMGWESPVEDVEALARLGSGEGWTLRIRGDQELARRAAGGGTGDEASRWWGGSVEGPLKVSDVAPDGFGASWRATVEPPGVSPAASR